MKDDPIYEGLDRLRHRSFIGETMSDHPKIATDADYAEQLKIRMRHALTEVVRIMAESNLRGLQVNFQIGPDGFMRPSIQAISVVKPL